MRLGIPGLKRNSVVPLPMMKTGISRLLMQAGKQHQIVTKSVLSPHDTIDTSSVLVVLLTLPVFLSEKN